MARAGMALRRGANQGNTDGNDDVQRSIELLDRVLSEFDDVENANQVQNIQQITSSTSTPHLRHSSSGATPVDDDSPSSLQAGHQSEDDGYMSMNGRNKQQKFATGPLQQAPFKPLAEHQQEVQLRPGEPDDFPPPPEEAQRLIATLLPKVSPSHRPKSRNSTGSGGGGGNVGGTRHHRSFPLTQLLPRNDGCIPPPQKFQSNDRSNIMIINGLPPDPIHTATQTTLPKTKHQRPYGWENNDFTLNPPPPPPGYRFGSLPYQHGVYPITSPTRMPPRTVPTAIERHREVKRHGSEDNLSSDLDETPALRPLSELADDEHFSDDSLEEALPPPPPPVCNKRASIAWEVPLDDEALLTPGSTKVVGRRRRKSGSHSSTSSIPNRLKELEDWPDPPPCTTEDEVMSPFSDSDDHIMLPPEFSSANVSGNSTYIIRRGKKDRKALMASSLTSTSSLNSRLSSELSIPAGRFSTDLNSRLSTPNSRYSVDLSTPHSRLSQELNSPKSRYSLDLNNSRVLASHELSSSPSRLSADLSSSRSSTPSKHGDVKKHSTTFDNIKSLMREGVVQDYESPKMESTSELNAASASPMVRVVSLPSLNAEEFAPRRELDVTVEEEEEAESSQPSTEISPLRKIEQNISELLERRDIEVVQYDHFRLNGVESLNKEKRRAPSKPTRDSLTRHRNDLQKSCSHNEIQKSEDYYRQLLMEAGNPFPKRNPIQKSESAKEMLIAHRERDVRLPTSTSADFPVRVDLHQHDFPPLPPSPVEEDEDEYSEILLHGRADTLPGDQDPPHVPPHREPPISNSLKSRSMDASYNRGRRNNYYNSSNRSSSSSTATNHNNNNINNNTLSERRTLPAEESSKRRPFQKRSMSHNGGPEEHHLQTSCSLPETPIFARGCDIPRTPHRRAPDVPGGGNQTAPRQSNTIGEGDSDCSDGSDDVALLNTVEGEGSLNTIATTSSAGGGSAGASYHRRGTHTGLEQAIVGAELLRLAGGPARGWYPKQRSQQQQHRRPASIEHLDRTTASWEQQNVASRKPLTLPPNLTPKFFQRSPRDALRRVTSLLVKKGNNGKEPKKDKEVVSPTIHENCNGEEVHKKKGFFKNFWKRSRHYSLEQQ